MPDRISGSTTNNGIDVFDPLAYLRVPSRPKWGECEVVISTTIRQDDTFLNMSSVCKRKPSPAWIGRAPVRGAVVPC